MTFSSASAAVRIPMSCRKLEVLHNGSVIDKLGDLTKMRPSSYYSIVEVASNAELMAEAAYLSRIKIQP